MIDVQAIDEPSGALWLDRLRHETGGLIADRTTLGCQIQEHGEIPHDATYLGGKPLLRRHDSLASTRWFVLDREYLWWGDTGTWPSNVETDRGPARAVRLQRTEKIEIALEILLGRLYRLQAEADAAGIRWADLVSAAVAP